MSSILESWPFGGGQLSFPYRARDLIEKRGTKKKPKSHKGNPLQMISVLSNSQQSKVQEVCLR